LGLRGKFTVKCQSPISKMIKNLNVYQETKTWKKPIHISKAALAKNYIKLLKNVEVIGITGSVGKTLTQNAAYSVLSQKYRVKVGDENLDPTFRIPQTILKTKPWDQKIILEYGVERPGDMDHYLSIIIPRIAVVTNVEPTHLKYFQNIEGVFKEKSKIVKALSKNGVAILNADDNYCHRMAKNTKAKVEWFGKRAKNGVKISHFEQSLFGSKFRLHYKGQKASVKWKVIGKHHLTSAYAAAALGLSCNLTLKQIAKGLSLTKQPIHRLNLIKSSKGNIIDDTYNSSPQAAKESIKTLIEIGKNRPKIAVLGEMKDLGSQSRSLHAILGGQIAKTTINALITVGAAAKEIAKAGKKGKFKGKIIMSKDTTEASEKIKKLFTARSVILIKGSRHAHLERIALSLLGKTTKLECYHCGQLV